MLESRLISSDNIALIVSLKFHPGHISHLVASYKQMEELGYNSVYYVHPNAVSYLPSGSRIICSLSQITSNVEVVLFLFPHPLIICKVIQLKIKTRNRFQSVYFFHEPLTHLNSYRNAGFSSLYILKLIIGCLIDAIICSMVNYVILPSKKALLFYNSNKLYLNHRNVYIPLLFDDEFTSKYKNLNRCFFSYIGTVAADHSFNEYLDFVTWAVNNKRLPDISFLIATRSDFEIPPALVNSSRVIIKKGKPLSDNEINESYASTIVVWNAYERTTQSGVLAKSFMFGTPAIVLRKNLSEFTEDGKEVIAIERNTSYRDIEQAIIHIMKNFEAFSKSARQRFNNTFFYRKYNDAMREILSKNID